MAATNDARCEELVLKAQKHLKKSFFSSPDPQAAGELYEKAANLYKLDKNWEKAGEMLERFAECQDAEGSTMGAARQYQAAALSYKNGKLAAQTAAAFKKAVSRYLEDGKFSQAGKAMRDLAEIQEAAGQFVDAYSSITSAIDYLDTAHEPIGASQLKSKAAQLAVECGEFANAAEYFESVAMAVTIPTSAVEPYFKAALCHLVAGDTVATSKSIQRFAGQSMDFARSPEFAFMDEAINAIDTSDHEAFQNALKKYEQKNKLDAWKRKLVTRIASALPAEGEDQLL